MNTGALCRDPAPVYSDLHAGGERHCHVPTWGAPVFFKPEWHVGMVRSIKRLEVRL